MNFVTEAQKGNIDLVEHAHKTLEQTEQINKEYKYITAYADLIEQAKKLQQNSQGKLCGIMISVKDNICVKGVESTASSAILKGYKPLYNATVIQKCIAEGAIILGKTVQDEFGFGGFATNVGKGYEKPLNPNDKKRTTGGSSGGAAGITKKAEYPHIALAESTGGSIVNPAAFCGVIGICPTYGTVSRYGLIDYANSLDKIGTMAKTIEEAALLLEIISGQDEKDNTTTDTKTKLTEIPNAIQGIRIGLIKEAYPEQLDSNIRRTIFDTIQKLEQKGARRLELTLPTTAKYALAAYYTLAMTETSTNLAKYCGLRYGATDQLTGSYNEYFTRVRTNNFGDEAKRRLLLGTFARMAGNRDAYYTKAAQARTKIIQEYQQAFKQADVLITPTMPIIAPTFEEIKKLTPLQHYLMDTLTVGPNLAGLPHITIPCGTINGMPIGIMIIGPHHGEQKIIQVAKAL